MSGETPQTNSIKPEGVIPTPLDVSKANVGVWLVKVHFKSIIYH
jgi:hypothetical protein